LALFVLPAAAAPDSPAAAPKRKPATSAAELGVRRPSWGKVRGWVLDARTRKPVAGARVQIEVDGEFAAEGKTTAMTREDGRYEAKAPLGRISSRFDWTRLLTLSPLTLLGGPSAFKKQTRALEVSRLNLRITREGYQPFLGVVKARRSQPGKFRLTLSDVWLAPEKAQLASFNPSNIRLEKFNSFTVEPRVLAPGDTLKVKLIATLPSNRDDHYSVYLTSTDDSIIADGRQLKLDKQASEGDRRVFAREIKLGKKLKVSHAEIGFYLLRNNYTLLRQDNTDALVQIVHTDQERAAAKLLDQGHRDMQAGDQRQAYEACAQARTANPEYPLALEMFGQLALDLNKPEEAVEAYAALVKLRPRDWRVAHPRHAEALVAAGRAAEAEAELAGAEQALGKNAPIPASIHLLRARIAAARGDFVAMDKDLTAAGQRIRIRPELLESLRIARTRKAIEEEPDSASLRLAYARVLGDAERWSEALEHILVAVKLEPRQPWAYLDMAAALRRLGRNAEAGKVIEFAVRLAPTNPEALSALADLRRRQARYADAAELYARVLKRQPRDLRAQHQHALMLYAAGQTEAARAQILALLKNARDKGDLRQSGLAPLGLYFGPKKRLIRGFTLPEADADIQILESLETLKKHPENALARLTLGAALVELDLPALAEPPLREALARAPELLEARFQLALAAEKQQRWEAAGQMLRAVLAANPLHPDARVELARCLAYLGRYDEARVQLLAHARLYPEELPRPPMPEVP